MDNRNERATQLIRKSAEEYIAREAGPQSLITVTQANLSSDIAHATVYITVFPEEKEDAALALMQRHVEEYKAFLRTRAKLPRVPHVEFKIDQGQKNFERLQ